jgi:hypothetical protein
MNIILKFALCFAVVLFTVKTYAQQRITDSAVYQTPANNAIAYFKQGVGVQSGLYNGQEYIPFNRLKAENVFFLDAKTWDRAILNYDGTTYTNVPMMYDLLRDIAVVQLYDVVNSFTLVTEKITDFTLLNHHFVYKYSDSLNTNGLKPGLYDQLYDGKTEVLVNRKRTLLILSGKNTFPEDDQLLVKLGDVYYPVGSQHKLLSVLKSKKKELRKYINDNNVFFKDNPEQSTIRIAAYYDKLTQ